MNQLNLCLIVPLARRRDPSTSHRAAERAAPIAPIHRNIILAALRDHGPLTQYGIERHTGLLAHKVGKRLIELQRLGLAEPTGEVSEGCRLWLAK